MATKVVMEALSPTMEEGRLVKWLKNEGDAIKSGEVLAEVETDKAIMELVARGDGVLRKRLANEGDASPVGTLLAVIAPAEENIDALIAEAGAAAPAAAPAAGAPAAAPPAPGGAEAESAVPAAPSESQGEASTPQQEAPQASEGGATAVAAPPKPPPGSGDDQTTAAQTPPAPSPPSPPPPQPQPGRNGRQPTSPLARRPAIDRGIELSLVRGSGPGGRIIKRDIESAMASAASRPKPAAAAAAPAKRVISREGDFQDVPLTQIRKTIARRLSESLGPIPTFYL